MFHSTTQRMAANHRRPLLIGIVLLLTGISVTCNSCRALPVNGLHDKERLAKEHLQLGMSVSEAKTIMDSFGFECTLLKNEPLTYFAKSDDIRPVVLDDVDYLNCVAKDRKGVVTGILAVKLLIEEDKIKETFFVWEFVGL